MDILMHKCKLIIQPVRRLKPRDNDGWKSLCDATIEGYFEACRLPTRNAANKNPRDDSANTPIDRAAYKGSLKVAILSNGNQ